MRPDEYEKLLARLTDIEQDVIYFPVRHHSPACAAHLAALIRLKRPSVVLIEGPSDFNEHFAELLLDHQLPIAIYSYFRVGQGHGSGAWYPFCEYSPEWVAIQTGREVGAQLAFIDLPWLETAHLDRTEHRYADAELSRGKYIATLCSRMQVDDFNELWDRLIEADLTLELGEFLQRVHGFCLNTRLDDISISRADAAREQYMRSQIEQYRSAESGTILVVTGGFHCAALAAPSLGIALNQRVETEEPASAVDVATEDHAHAPLPANAPADAQPPADNASSQNAGSTARIERGIALTTYSYERLDALTGYNSGMPNPGFYEHAWRSRRDNDRYTHRPLLSELAVQLRKRKQTVSTADLVAVETAAIGLSALRGREQVWRSDLIDAVLTALVKDESHYAGGSPFLDAVHAVLRGGKVGALASGTRMPPLVQDIRGQLELHELKLNKVSSRMTLDLSEPTAMPVSRLLHRLRLLGIHGFQLSDGTDFLSRGAMERLWEQWDLRWTHDFESSCIEAARYGTNLLDAVTRRLQEMLQSTGLNAATAAALVVDASRAGIDTLSGELIGQIGGLIRQESDFGLVTEATGHLTWLYCYDETLGTQRSTAIAQLLAESYSRSLWLMDALGGSLPSERAALAGMRVLQEVAQRAGHILSESREDLSKAFGRVQDDPGKHSLVRGAASGILWNLGQADPDSILSRMIGFADPNELGNFLTGLFALARELAQRQPRLVQTIDRLLMEFSVPSFQEALPSLRLAFTYFTPREKHYMLTTLFETLGMQQIATLPKLVVTPEQAAQAMVIEDRLLRHHRTIRSRRRTMNQPDDPLQRQSRWRLVMGAGAEQLCGGLSGEEAERDKLLSFLYDREYGSDRNVRGSDGSQKGSMADSQLTVPDWINQVHQLFPKRTIERLEKDALERYQLEEMVTNPEVLARAQPNATLLKAVLRTKHLMNQEVLAAAQALVRKVVDDLMKRLAQDVRNAFGGSLDRRTRSFVKMAKNFDIDTTIRRNLKHYDPDEQRILIETPFFFSRIRKQIDRWQMIVVVDESGSMLDSVIHSAVTASIFYSMKMMKVHLCIFDTQVVDLTDQCVDPVETLMKVQLGGGTDIGQAVEYALSLVENPRRTIVVLVTDFFEGAPIQRLYAAARKLVESGVTCLGLAALDENAEPTYDHEVAARLVHIGWHVGAMTPGELATWVAEKVRK